MLHAALAFLPFAAFLAVLPGPATAMVIQSAAHGGRPRAMRATAGDAAGLALWAVASMLGVSALLVASEVAFTTLKVFGAIVLIAYGVAAIRAARRGEPAHAPRARKGAFRMGLMTALTNPKVGLFYVALLPQFVPAGHAGAAGDAAARRHPDLAQHGVVLRPRLRGRARPRGVRRATARTCRPRPAR